MSQLCWDELSSLDILTSWISANLAAVFILAPYLMDYANRVLSAKRENLATLYPGLAWEANWTRWHLIVSTVRSG